MKIPTEYERVIKSFRMKDEVHHLARVAAITARQTLGEWILEAADEKLNRASEEPRGLAGESHTRIGPGETQSP